MITKGALFVLLYQGYLRFPIAKSRRWVFRLFSYGPIVSQRDIKKGWCARQYKMTQLTRSVFVYAQETALHHRMTKQEIRKYFGTNSHDEGQRYSWSISQAPICKIKQKNGFKLGFFFLITNVFYCKGVAQFVQKMAAVYCSLVVVGSYLAC